MENSLYIPIDTLIKNTVKCPKLVKRGDTILLQIKVFTNGSLADLSQENIDLILKKADGKLIEKTIDKTNISNGVILVSPGQQSSLVEGDVYGELQIYTNNTMKSSNTFIYTVDSSLADNVLEISKDDIQVLADLRNLIDKAEITIEQYKDNILAIGNSVEAIQSLANIKSYIETNLSDLESANAQAVVNITTANATKTALDTSNSTALATKTALDTSNTNANTTKTALNTLNTTANTTKTALDTSNSTALATKTALDTSNTNANTTKTALNTLNTTANATKTALDTSNTTALATKTSLDSANVQANANITAMQNFGDVTALTTTLTAFKNEVQTARGTEANLDARLDKFDTSLSEIEQQIKNQIKPVTNPTYIVNKKFTDVVKNYGNPVINGTSATTNTTRFNNTPVDNSGYLKKISLYSSGSGAIKVKILAKNTDSTFNVIKELGTFNVVAGMNVISETTNYTPYLIQTGSYVAVYSNSVSIIYNTGGSSYAMDGDLTGSNLTIGTSGAKLSLSFDVQDQLSNWVFNGNWTFQGGLKCADVTGGWGTYAIFNKSTTLDRTMTRARITINDITSKFSIIRKSTVNDSGTVAEIDCNSKTLKFYGSWNGGTTPPNVISTFNIPFNFISGREYLVTLQKVDGTSIFKIIDTVTNDSATLINSDDISPYLYVGGQWDSPGIMFHNGNIVITKFEYVSLCNNKSKVICLGDSYTEGNSLSAYGGYDYRWCAKLYKTLSEDVIIAGRGGENSGSLINRLDIDLDSFNPKYVIVLIGANDSDYSTWNGNINTIIARIKAKNAIPILGTIAPRVDRQTFINQANTWIRASGYSYIDFAKVLTLNNDSVTQNPLYFLSDAVHPNVEGHELMYKKCLVDAPEIFD